MAASTSARYDIASDAVSRLLLPVAGSIIIYQGVLVAHQTNGFTVQIFDTAGHVLAGIAEQTVDNTGGANGDKNVPVQPINGIAGLNFIELEAANPDDSWLGKQVFFVDDNIVALAATTTNDVLAGMVRQILVTGGSGKVLIDLLTRTAA